MGSQVVNGKPAPDLFLAAAGILGLEPSTCLAVEDAASGAEVSATAPGVGDYRLVVVSALLRMGAQELTPRRDSVFLLLIDKTPDSSLPLPLPPEFTVCSSGRDAGGPHPLSDRPDRLPGGGGGMQRRSVSICCCNSNIL